MENKIIQIPADQYHESKAIGRSGLYTLFTKSPAHFKYGETKETDAMVMGTMFHCALLEPHDFEKKYRRKPDGMNGATKEGKAFTAQAEADGVEAVSAKDYDATLAMRDAVLRDATVRKILEGAQIEPSAFWKHSSGHWCKSRPDIYNAKAKVLVDIKTTKSATRESFQRSVIDYGYHVQEAMGLVGFRECGAEVDQFLFLSIEKEAPHVAVFDELSVAASQEGFQIFERAMEIYADCVAKNEWPGYPHRVGEKATGLKPWQLKFNDDGGLKDD